MSQQYPNRRFSGEEIQTLSNIQNLVALCYGDAVKAGWHHELDTGERRNVPFAVRLMLCVTELAEACEGDRKNLMDDKLPHRPMRDVELADCLIRILDMAGAYNIDIAGSVVDKLAYNRSRADHKPETRLAAGGKSY